MEVPRSSIIAVSALGAPAHFFFYFIFKYGLHLPYENFALRMIATLLCLSVILKSHIPKKFQHLFPVYWRFTMIFVLPFIFTVNLIMNNFNELWLYWEIFMVFVLMIFEQNWLMFLLDIIIGVIGAILFYLISPSHIVLNPAFNITFYSIVILFSIVVGYAFSYSKWIGLRRFEHERSEEKARILEALAGGIAHEVRNPLSQIHLNLDEIRQELPTGFSDTNEAVIRKKNVDSINKRLSQAEMAVNRGLHVINVTLANFRKDDFSEKDMTCLSAIAVTRKAIEEYGYASEQERQMVHLIPKEDFVFLGDENNYILVLYNLLVNALYALFSVPGGRIDITIHREEKGNTITIRDNGPGIPANILPMIFDPYFTSGKKSGTGLGLVFCKRVMQSFKGEITCNSEEGRYTEFTLVFPILDQALVNKYESNLYAEYQSVFFRKKLLLAGIPGAYAPHLRSRLAPLDIERDEASDLSEALRMIAKKRYDLILANTTLPPFGIEELMSGMRKSGQDIPVIACSSLLTPASESCTSFDALVSLAPALPELLDAMKSSLEKVRESLSGKTVLVADDLDFNRKVIRSMLGKTCVTILEATNGREVLDILKSHPCDLLIMDMRMPVLDGFETAKQIRTELPPWRDIPILGMSGNLDNATLKMAKECGMNDTLIKPLKLKPFQQKVLSMLKADRTD